MPSESIDTLNFSPNTIASQYTFTPPTEGWPTGIIIKVSVKRGESNFWSYTSEATNKNEAITISILGEIDNIEEVSFSAYVQEKQQLKAYDSVSYILVKYLENSKGTITK